MAAQGITTGTEFLLGAARAYIAQTWQPRDVRINEPFDKDLAWTPSLSFSQNKHRRVIIEVSDKPYPKILAMRHAALLNLDMPIAVYSACPERAYLKHQTDAKELVRAGYGLLTVDDQGNVMARHHASPQIQLIPTFERDNAMKEIPQVLRARLAESFLKYEGDPPSGTSDIAEFMEALVLKAGRDAYKKGWIDKKHTKPGAPADTLKAMQQVPQLGAASAPIGAVQNYISSYRNVAHHAPKNAKQAAQKYRDCRHAFLEGVRTIPRFRTAMKNAGLSGSIAVI
jgi:hypothetical protein